MKLYRSGSARKLNYFISPNASEIAVTKVNCHKHLPYSDEDSDAITGIEVLELPVCCDREEFIREINKSKWIHVSLLDDKFHVQDVQGVLGDEPTGVYTAGNAEKRMVLIKDESNEYKLRDLPEFDFVERIKCLFFRGGSKVDFHGDINLVGTTSDSKILQSPSLLLGSDASTENNRYHSKKSRGELAVAYRCIIRDDECTMNTDGKLVFPALAIGDSIVLSVVGKNNGFLLQSTFMGFIDPLHLRSKHDILKTCVCGFVVRANKLFENVAIESVAEIPVDIKQLKFVRIANGSVEIKAIRKDDTEVLCFRTPILSDTSQFVMADFGNTVSKFEIPLVLQKATLTTRNGALVVAFKSPASNTYDVLTSPKFDVSVSSGKVLINNINTNLSVSQNTIYILSVEKTADLSVELYQNGVGATSYTQAGAGASYSYTVAQDGVITWKSGIELGPWGMSPEIVDIDQMIQVVRAEIDGIAMGSNLATLTGSNFGSFGATYVDGILTLNGVEYTRQPLILSSQIQHILRLNSEEITGDVHSDRKTYTNRIESLKVYANSLSVQGYNHSNLIAIVEPNKEVQNEQFHRVRGEKIELYYEVVDAQTHLEIGTTHPDYEVWSVTLSVR